MQKNMLIAIGGGGLSAVASMAFLSGAPGALFLVYVATLPLFLVAFSAGTLAVAIAGISGVVLSGLAGGIFTSSAYGIFHALPAWLVSRQSLLRQTPTSQEVKWNPIGNVLSVLVLACAGLLTIAAFYAAGETGGDFSGAVTQNLYDALTAMLPGIGDAERMNMVDLIAPIFFGAMGGSWVLMTALNAVIAQGILVKMGKNIRPTPKFSMMTLPNWLSLPLIGVAILSLITQGDVRYIAQSIIIVLATPYFLLGLSVAHWAVRRISFGGAVLAGFYLMMVLSGWAMIVIAGVGMIEQWAGIRNKFNQNSTNVTTDIDA